MFDVLYCVSKFFTRNEDNDVAILGQDSWPSFRPLRATDHPPLMELICLNQTGIIDLRLLYLKRSLVSSVSSAKRRFKGSTNDYVRVALASLDDISLILRQPYVTFEVGNMAAPIEDQALALSRLLRGIKIPSHRNRGRYLSENDTFTLLTNALANMRDSEKAKPRNYTDINNTIESHHGSWDREKFISFLSSKLWLHRPQCP